MKNRLGDLLAYVSGRLQVVCQFVADQPFWARRMHFLGWRRRYRSAG